MIARIRPTGRLCGKVRLPSSKSAAHRALIAAAVATGTSRIYGIDLSNDISATIDGLRTLGATVNIGDGVVEVVGIEPVKQAVNINCGESGSTLRFLIPIAAAYGIEATFYGSGRLPERPLDEIVILLKASGIECEHPQGLSLPLKIRGRLKPDEYVMSGAVSSQYITGMLFALCAMGGGSIRLKDTLQSAGYVDMTVDTLHRFGADIAAQDGSFTVKNGPSPCDITVEGDWSQAAFFLSAATLGGNIALEGLDPNSVQGDRACVELFSQMGCKIEWRDGVLHAEKGELRPIEVDASQIPDMVPALAATMAFLKGKSRIYNAARLRLKESDRLAAMADGLTRMGVECSLTDDSITVVSSAVKGAGISGYNDHRIVMAFSVAACFAEGESEISDPQAISKSYPDFFKDYQSIGGDANVIRNR